VNQAMAEIPLKPKTPYKNPTMGGMMKGMMRKMMNGMMAIKASKGADCTYEEVSAFMVPKMFNPEKPNYKDFLEQRPYCVPGYVSKAPQPGDTAPDGPITAAFGGATSTLLAEAKALATKAGSKKVVISFDSITCPFWRNHCGEDLYKVAKAAGVPTLHVQIREAHPADEFDAPPNKGGPIGLKRTVNKHTSMEDRTMAAKDAHAIIAKFEKQEVQMWMDAMDDALEAAYEARPWRQYVIEAETAKVIDSISLTPFNMPGKLKKLKAAVA